MRYVYHPQHHGRHGDDRGQPDPARKSCRSAACTPTRLMQAHRQGGYHRPYRWRFPRISAGCLSPPTTSRPVFHIRMQAAFQRAHGQRCFQDRELSSRFRHPRGCGSKSTRWPISWAARASPSTGTAAATSQVLNIGKRQKRRRSRRAASAEEEPQKIRAPPAPGHGAMGVTERVKIGCGNLYVTVNYDDKRASARSLPVPARPAAAPVPDRSDGPPCQSVALRSGIERAQAVV